MSKGKKIKVNGMDWIDMCNSCVNLRRSNPLRNNEDDNTAMYGDMLFCPETGVIPQEDFDDEGDKYIDMRACDKFVSKNNLLSE